MTNLTMRMSYTSINKKRYSLEKKKARLGILLLSPALVVVAFAILYPMAKTLLTGFFDVNMMDYKQGNKFVGLENYLYLFNTPEFWKGLTNNVIITGISVVMQITLGMLIALMLHMEFRGRGLARGLFVVPWVTPTFVSAFVWVWLLDAQYGLINMILMLTGIIKEGFPWLGELNTVLPSVIIIYTWKGIPWVIITLLSGLQMVPRHLQEAAKVDGANAWQEFWHVTVACMRNVILIVILLRIIWMFNWFDLMFLLTGGGPIDATMTWPIQVYKTAFEVYNFGRASALGGIMFVFLAVFSIFYFKSLGKEGDL